MVQVFVHIGLKSYLIRMIMLPSMDRSLQSILVVNDVGVVATRLFHNICLGECPDVFPVSANR